MIIGFIGMFLNLLGYYLKTNNKVNDLIWHAINTIGNICLLSYAIVINTLPFMLFNIVFILISVKGIYDFFNKPKILLNEKKQVN